MTPSETKHRTTTEAITLDPMCTMDAKEWKYVGEGGKHALFSFLPMTSSRCCSNSTRHQQLQRWQGRLLRISKKDLRMATKAQGPVGMAGRPTTSLVDPPKSATPSHQVKGEGEGTRGDIRGTIHHELDSLYYVQHFVAPALSETYVDIPQLLALNGAFLDQLRDQTLALDDDDDDYERGPRIPLSRRKDWQRRAAALLALEPKTATTTSTSIVEETRPTILSSSPQPDEPQLIYGTLLVDYKQWTWNSQPSVVSNSDSTSCDNFNNISSSNMNTTISVEIKPKAGYKAFSPLVDPMHRIKYQEPRFSLLQQLYAQGHIQKGWTLQDTAKTKNHDEKKDATATAWTSTPRTTSRPFQVSSYDPMDLFSTVPARIQTALSSLFSCPQNNLRVWQGDNQVIGLGSSDIGNKDDVVAAVDSSIRRSATNLNSKSSTDGQSSTSNGSGIHPCSDYSKDFLAQILPGIVASILSQEGLLPRLLQLQRLDVLDADGAILVYHRLVTLYGGSHKEAERALDDYTAYSSSRNSSRSPPTAAVEDESPSATSSLPPDLLSASPFPSLELESATVHAMCLEIERFRQLMEGAAGDKEDSRFSEPQQCPSEEDTTRIRHECIRQVEYLSTQECIYLLHNWLLSLSMCDVSLFVTLRPDHGKEEPDHEATSPFKTRPGGIVSPATTSSRTIIVRTADGKNPGVLVFHDADGSSQAFYYTLKVIDCDGKPAKKLRSRQEKESPFRLLQFNPLIE